MIAIDPKQTAELPQSRRSKLKLIRWSWMQLVAGRLERHVWRDETWRSNCVISLYWHLIHPFLSERPSSSVTHPWYGVPPPDSAHELRRGTKNPEWLLHTHPWTSYLDARWRCDLRTFCTICDNCAAFCCKCRCFLLPGWSAPLWISIKWMRWQALPTSVCKTHDGNNPFYLAHRDRELNRTAKATAFAIFSVVYNVPSQWPRDERGGSTTIRSD